MSNAAEHLFNHHYDEGGIRAFLFGATFKVERQELLDFDVGPSPKNYKKPDVIAAWADDQRDKIFANPASTLFLGEIATCEVTADDGTIVTTHPVDAIRFLGQVLKAGAIVLGVDAANTLQAMAAWGAKQANAVAAPVSVWRRAPLGVNRSMLADPLDFILGSSASLTKRNRLCQQLKIFDATCVDNVSRQIEDMQRLMQKLLDETLSDVYYDLFGGK